MPKSKEIKDKTAEIDAALKALEKTREQIIEMQKNMEVLNGNMQHAIDLQEEMVSDLDKVKKRMGL